MRDWIAGKYCESAISAALCDVALASRILAIGGRRRRRWCLRDDLRSPFYRSLALVRPVSLRRVTAHFLRLRLDTRRALVEASLQSDRRVETRRERT